MYISSAIGLLLEALVFGLYVGVPLVANRASIIERDWADALDFRQSTACVVWLALLRALLFVYVICVTKSSLYKTTRCFVFLIVCSQLCILTVLSLIVYIFQNDSKAFSLFRSDAWMTRYWWSVVLSSMVATAFQALCVICRNREREIPGNHEEEHIQQLLEEKKGISRNDPSSVAIDDALFSTKKKKLERWRDKWEKLVSTFRSTTDPTFNAVLRIYAHKDDAAMRLEHLYDADPKEFEFYIPQLCSFLLLGAFQQSSEGKLSLILLRVCKESHVFAQKMRWYLESYCVGSPAYSSEESRMRVQMLIDEISVRGLDPSKKLLTHQAMGEKPLALPTANVVIAPESEILLKDNDTTHYQTFQPMHEVGAVNPFTWNHRFVSELVALSSNLRLIPRDRDQRNMHLRQVLAELQTTFLPSLSLFVPVGNPFHRIKKIHLNESFTFSTRERVPYLLCLEVVDFFSYEKKPMDRFAQLKNRFRLSMVASKADSSKPSTPVVRPGDLEGAETPVVRHVTDPDNLGFWSEPKMPETTLLDGLLGSLKPKALTPLSGPPFQSARAISSKEESLLPHHTASPLQVGASSFEYPYPAHLSPKVRVRPLSIHIPSSHVDHVLSPTPSEGMLTPTEAARLRRADSTDEFLASLRFADDAEPSSHHHPYHHHHPVPGPRSPSSSDLPCVIFKERWVDKEARLRATSPWGHLPTWRLLPVIVKSNDDLRQEQFASQLIRQFANVFSDAKLPVFLRPYDVLATSPTAGLVEAIADTISLDSLKKNDPEFVSLQDFYARRFGDPSSSTGLAAQKAFVESMAAYSIVCYLLQIKDRHNGNILVDADGHVIHIDFGFMLSNSPGNAAFESAPFKLTSDFVEVMGGPRSAAFRRFRSLCVRSFLVARKYRYRITLLVEMMVAGNEDLPCFQGDPRGTVDRLADRFRPDLSVHECEDFVHQLIDASLDNWRTRWYDKYQRWFKGKNGITHPLKRGRLEWGRHMRTKKRQFAATMIQRKFRAYRYHMDHRETRDNVRSTMQRVKLHRIFFDREFWEGVNLRDLKRAELEDLAFRLELPTTMCKKEHMIRSIQHWIDLRMHVQDVAIEAAMRATEKKLQVGYCSTLVNQDTFDLPYQSTWLANPMPMQTLRIGHIESIQVTHSHAMALAKAGEVYSWGSNAHGQLGADNATKHHQNPVVVGAIESFVTISIGVGAQHSMAVCNQVKGRDGVLFAWGSNSHAQLGLDEGGRLAQAIGDNIVSQPRKVTGLIAPYNKAIDIACGPWHTAALMVDRLGQTSGVLGQGNVLHATSPHMVILPPMKRANEPLEFVKVVSCGMHHTAVLTETGSLYTWGSHQAFSPLPHKLPSLKGSRGRIATIACGASFTAFCILAMDEQLYEAKHRHLLWHTRLRPSAEMQAEDMLKKAAEDALDGIDLQDMLHPRYYLLYIHPLSRTTQKKTDLFMLGVGKRKGSMGEYEAVRKLQGKFRQRQGVKFLHQTFLERIQRVFSIRHDAFFYFNTCNHHKSWARPTLLPLHLECPIRDPDDDDVIKPPYTVDDAARVIQSLYRSRKARKLVQAILRSRYETCVNKVDGRTYYRDRRTNAVRWDNPFHDVPKPIKRRRGMSEAEAIATVQRCVRGAKARKNLRLMMQKRFQAVVDTFFNETPTVEPRKPRPTTYTKATAASTLQRLYRGRKARRNLVALVQARFQQAWDPTTQQPYFVDTVTKTTTWSKPALLKHVEIPPVYNTIIGHDSSLHHKRKKKKAYNMNDVDAAIRLQAALRSKLARKRAQKQLHRQYERVWDPETKAHFYHNIKTDVVTSFYYDHVNKTSSWTAPLLLQKRTRLTSPSPTKFKTQDSAAVRIQGIFRLRKARQEALHLAQASYEKVFDETVQAYYYFNLKTGESQWTKPKCFRASDAARVVNVDGEGQVVVEPSTNRIL
ncbi:hypothetical protein B5M09_000905 [Aphanomyces astaci]|uniref:1-phosphatidylinositol 4-kinase n=1 Tax=Aphanomyces astaci TaxID=112090 RepID=A0A425D7X8_APHAT|nr:hypothetical protein B5M09_000905 [Aphanomyces astaci]